MLRVDLREVADPDKARRAMGAMMGMTKIDLAVFRATLEIE